MNTICIFGLGYIGLPTACMFALSGKQVIGVDINPKVIDTLRSGQLHIEEPGLAEVLQQAVTSGCLTVQTKPTLADVFIIAVPTPINPDKTADMGAVIAATQSIVPFLRKGNLVVLESTSPPRTTTNLVQPLLESGGLRAGIDFQLAYSPERVLPGQILKEMRSNARVIGGIDRASSEAGSDLYAAFVKGEIVLTDATTAEMVKLMENTFRDVNIALANEFALIAEHVGVNVWEAIPIANRHPRVKVLTPGPGVGGHCIAVDPWFLVEMAPQQSQLIRYARQVNDSMPQHVVDLVRQAVEGIAQPVIACLGLAYKANVDDIRESPSMEVVHRLKQSGYQLRACDPHVTELADLDVPLLSIREALRDADCLLLLTDHAEFRSIGADILGIMRHPIVVDTRNACKNLASSMAGVKYYAIGLGNSA